MFLVRRRDGEEGPLVRGHSMLPPRSSTSWRCLLGQVGLLGVGQHVLRLKLAVLTHLPLTNTLQKAHRIPSACSTSKEVQRRVNTSGPSSPSEFIIRPILLLVGEAIDLLLLVRRDYLTHLSRFWGALQSASSPFRGIDRLYLRCGRGRGL